MQVVCAYCSTPFKIRKFMGEKGKKKRGCKNFQWNIFAKFTINFHKKTTFKFFCLTIKDTTLTLYAFLKSPYTNKTTTDIEPKAMNRHTQSNTLRELAPLLNLGIEMVVIIGIFGGIGWFLDKHLSTSPLWFAVLLVVGVVVGMYKLINAVLAQTRRTTKPQHGSDSTPPEIPS
jgi:F0F1-type ATP synthase assembly protein I